MSAPPANARAGDSARRVELHRAALSQALGGFASRPVASALTLVVLALALALPLFVAMGFATSRASARGSRRRATSTPTSCRGSTPTRWRRRAPASRRCPASTA